MELTNQFRVGVPVPDAWKVLTDVERIAPLLPGAQLQEVEGDEYRGVVKVKVGPITAEYKGTATFVEQDEAGGKVVLKASGRDTRGQGNATALITATLTADGDQTEVSVTTDLTVTGKVAQFGRGVMAEVSAKLLGQFVDALHEDIASAGVPGSGAASALSAAATDATAATGSAAADGPPDRGSIGAEPVVDLNETAETGTRVEANLDTASTNGSLPSTGPRRIEGPEAEPLDLLAVAGGSTMKRLLPVAGVLVLVLLVLGRRSRARAASKRTS